MKEETEMKRSMLERLKTSRPPMDLSGFIAGPKRLPHPVVSVEADADLGDSRRHPNVPVPKSASPV